MSAWYIFSAVGFYPVAPGSTQYVIGTPLFDRATIAVGGGREFVVRARRRSAESPFVQGASLNGAPYGNSFLEHDVLARGGEIVFDLAEAPNTAWGSSRASRPTSSVEGPLVLAAPFVATGRRSFRGSQEITLGSADTDVEIWYSIERQPGAPDLPAEAGSHKGSVSAGSHKGANPPAEAGSHKGGISWLPALAGRPNTIADSVTLRAQARRGSEVSPTIAVTFRRVADYPRISLSAPYSNQYAAGGDDALIDGLRGGRNFRVGRWQGYQGHDLDVTLDFGEVRDITRVSMGFLQDTGSWIFMPRGVAVAVSDDGRSFRDVGRVSHAVPDREERPLTRDLTLDVRARARYLRVRVQRYGRLPDWHPGAGAEAWLFADEIVVR
jgi:hypothetical protein